MFSWSFERDRLSEMTYHLNYCWDCSAYSPRNFLWISPTAWLIFLHFLLLLNYWGCPQNYPSTVQLVSGVLLLQINQHYLTLEDAHIHIQWKFVWMKQRVHLNYAFAVYNLYHRIISLNLNFILLFHIHIAHPLALPSVTSQKQKALASITLCILNPRDAVTVLLMRLKTPSARAAPHHNKHLKHLCTKFPIRTWG